MSMRTLDHARMSARRPKQSTRLYIGEWISRLGRKQNAIAKAAGIGESHLSLVISGKRRASVDTLMAIADALGISINDLKRSPPPRSAMEAVRQLDPDQVAVLARLLDQMKDGRHN